MASVTFCAYVFVCLSVCMSALSKENCLSYQHQTWYTYTLWQSFGMLWPGDQKVKGQGYTVMKTVMVAWLLMKWAALGMCCCCCWCVTACHMTAEVSSFVWVSSLCVILSAGGDSNIVHSPALQDDPQRRRPDISRAKMYIGWQPQVSQCSW